MLHKRLLPHFAFLILFLCASFPVVDTQAQDSQSTAEKGGGKKIGDLGTNKQNKSAIRKLSRMSPDEVKALDVKLTQALEYYYDQDFSRAFTLFKEIAAKADTMDVMYWLGTSAMVVGENEVAIANFKKILTIDPTLNKVRIRLANAYFRAGYFKEARQELERVKRSHPSPAEQRQVDALSKVIEKEGKVFIWSLKVSQGILYDDNLNASANRNEYETLLGSVERNDNNRQLHEWASVSNVVGNFRLDLGEPKGFMWDTTLSFYNKSYFDYGDDYNYMKMEAKTGPWWAGRNFLIKIPGGYTEHRFGNDRLGYTLFTEPSIQIDFHRYFSLKGEYTLSYTDYSSDDRSDLDNLEHKFEMTPLFFFANRRVVLGPGGGYYIHNADVEKYSYDGPFVSIYCLTQFPTRTTFFLRYQYFWKGYEDRALPLYQEVREDKQGVLTAAIRQGIVGNLFAVFVFYYLHNDSNLELYDYDRRIYMLNLEYRF
ncbi:tetratricopeptide repeat protein [Thermodesulfobacteriota bacterium]